MMFHQKMPATSQQLRELQYARQAFFNTHDTLVRLQQNSSRGHSLLITHKAEADASRLIDTVDVIPGQDAVITVH